MRVTERELREARAKIEYKDIPGYFGGVTDLREGTIVINNDNAHKDFTTYHEVCHLMRTVPARGQNQGVTEIVEDAWVQYHWWPDMPEAWAAAMNEAADPRSVVNDERLRNCCLPCLYGCVNVCCRTLIQLEACREHGYHDPGLSEKIRKLFPPKKLQLIDDFIDAVKRDDREGAREAITALLGAKLLRWSAKGVYRD